MSETTKSLLAIGLVLAWTIFIEWIFWRLSGSGKHLPHSYSTENSLEVIPGETRDTQVGKTAISGEGL